MVIEASPIRRALLLSAVLPWIGVRPARAQGAMPGGTLLAAAWDDARHWIGRVRIDGDPVTLVDAIEVPTRAHGLTCLPDGSVLAVARRPGEWMLRWKPAAGAPTDRAQWLWAAPERRFNGHVLAHRGRLFTTETDLDSGEGRLVQRDAQTLDAIEAWPTGGRDPHDIEALPDGSLLVANGGIDTQPETGRSKRALDRMDASLVRIDPLRGQQLGQWRLADARLSVRHLAFDARSGQVGVALQAEHDSAAERERAPVFALFDPATSTLDCVPSRMPGSGYAGDVAACAAGWAVSRPRDNDVLLWARAASMPRAVPLREGCALATEPDGARAWALGLGGIAALTTNAHSSAAALRFDNHAVLWHAA